MSERKGREEGRVAGLDEMAERLWVLPRVV
jgi:hypothetical protein